MVRGIVLLVLGRTLGCRTTTEPAATAVPTDNRPLPEWQQLTQHSGTRLQARAGQLWLTDTQSAGWHSADRGASWQRNLVNDTLFSVTTANDEGNHWYAAGQGQFYRSTNAGQTWSVMLTTPAYQQPSLTVAADGSVLTAGGNACQIQRSVDAGASWDILPLQTADCFPTRIVASPNYVDDATIYILTAKQGIFVSRSAGTSWEKLTTLTAAEFGVDPTNPQRLFLIAENRPYRSFDGGTTWEQLQLSPDGPFHSTALALGANGRLYIGTLAGLLFDSADQGSSFRQLPLAEEIETVRDIAVGANTIYLLTRRGVYAGYLPGAIRPAVAQVVLQPTKTAVVPMPTLVTTTPIPTATPLPTATPTIEPTVSLPTATLEPTTTATPTPESTAPASAIALEPDIVAAHIVFDSWSPRERFAAFWVSSEQDVAAQLPGTSPGGTLAFWDIRREATCLVDQIQTEAAFTAILHWQQDGTVVVVQGDKSYRGEPCRAFAEINDFSLPQPETADPKLSPNGRYRAETVLLNRRDGLLSFETTLLEGERPLHVVAWQIDERLGDYDGWLGGEWVSPTQFVLYETFYQGSLLMDAENGVIPILTDLLGFEEVPNLRDDGYSLAAWPLSSSKTYGYHLLREGIGDERNFPLARLYHAETGAVEELPAARIWSPHAVAGWLLLNANDYDTGYERHNLLRRRLEDTTGIWEPWATDVDWTVWDANTEQVVWIQGEETAVWEAWPSGVANGRYSTAPYWTRPTQFSPNGNHIALIGNLPGQPRYGLFFVSKP